MNATSTLVKPQQCLIEVIVRPDAANNIPVIPAYFTDDVIKFMLNRKVIAIESYCDVDFQFSPLTPSMQIIPSAVFLQMGLTLLREDGNGIKGGDFFSKIPLSWFRRQVMATASVPSCTDLWRCDPVGVSWSDSFISYQGTSTIQQAFSVPFLVTWLLPDQHPDPYRVNKLKR